VQQGKISSNPRAGLRTRFMLSMLVRLGSSTLGTLGLEARHDDSFATVSHSAGRLLLAAALSTWVPSDLLRSKEATITDIHGAFKTRR